MNYFKNNSEKILLRNETFKISDLLNFSYGILITLLTYNKNKIQLVKPILEINDDVEICLDQTRIKQILLNFISNAVKFTKRGYIKIKAQKNISNQLVIYVEDTGMGIKEEDLEKIFVQEKMLGEHLNENHMGSGLGLSISFQMAKSMNCEVNFNSKFEKGSTFFIQIPLPGNKIKARAPSTFLKTKIGNKKLEIKRRNKSEDVKSLSSLIKKEENFVSNFNKKFKEIIEPENFDKISENNNINLIEIDEENLYLDDDNILIIEKENSEINKSLSTKIRDVCMQISRSRNMSKLYTNEDIIKSSKSTSSFSSSFHSIKLNSNTNTTRNKAILIIDDTSVILNSMERIIKLSLKNLNLKNIEIIKGNDGVDLIKQVIIDQSQNRILCIFTDENMEYLSGSEACKIIRDMEYNNRINKQIICSISAGPELNSGNKDKLFDYHFEKPLISLKFEEFLKKILKN
jgi:CheY-like chemotaxis protein